MFEQRRIFNGFCTTSMLTLEAAHWNVEDVSIFRKSNWGCSHFYQHMVFNFIKDMYSPRPVDGS